MKKTILFLFAIISLTCINTSTFAQKTAKTVETKAAALNTKEAGKYKLPVNVKGSKAVKTRGDIYGADYSDITVNNYSSYYVEIWVDGSYRTLVAPMTKIVTWARPGYTRLVGVARFPDGSHLIWGPFNPITGYQYTWDMTN